MTSATTTAREYLRVSIDRSGREKSQTDQHAENAAAVDRQGWKLGQPYKDTGSASRHARRERVDYGRLIADLDSGQFRAQILVLWESSRGSRRVSEWAKLIELCEDRGVKIYVTSDGRLYDPGDDRDRRTLHEEATDAEWESGRIRKRVRRGMAAQVAAGRPHGRVPLGYRRLRDPATGLVSGQEIEPTEAVIVREVFDRIHKGHSLRSIAMDFESRGVRSRTGAVFSPGHIRAIATRRAYCGEREHGPTGEVVEAIWPALVKRRLWLAVNRKLTAPERRTSRPGRAVHLLSLIARCDVCSGPMTARTVYRDGREELVYTCRESGHVRVPHDELDRFAEKLMLIYLAKPDLFTQLAAESGNDVALDAVQEEVASIRAELADLADRVGAGQISATLAARAEPKIEARLKEAEARELALARPAVLDGLLTPGKDVARRWKAAPMSSRREVARLLLTPTLMGELRVTRSPSPGHRHDIAARVTWRTQS